MTKITKKIYTLAGAGYILLPLVVAAQSDIDKIIGSVGKTFTRIIGLLFVAATLVFLWGVIQFIAGSADPSKRDKAKGIMTWGIIGLAVMAAAWGITRILIDYFLPGGGIGPNIVPVPQIPSGGIN